MSSSGAQRSPVHLLTAGDFDPLADQGIEYDFLGRVIAGRYTVHEHIGGGGMADVYRATDQQLGIDVAIKHAKLPIGPRCNDGKVQDVEECDLAENNGSGEYSPGGVPCDDGCRYQARLVFLSSVAYKGGEIGGVEGAHTKCQLLAEQAGYDNSKNFMAWLSDALHSPAQDFLHTPGLPFVRPDGVRIADDWDDLVKNGPHEGIFVTEKGESLLDARVWTGTSQSGNLLDPAAHCKSWTTLSPEEESRVGSSGVD